SSQSGRRLESDAHHRARRARRTLAERLQVAGVRALEPRLANEGRREQVQGLAELRPLETRTHRDAGRSPRHAGLPEYQDSRDQVTRGTAVRRCRMSRGLDFKSERDCLMRIRPLSIVVTLLVVSGTLVSGAQNPPAPAGVAPRLDTPQARVIVATLQPRTPAVASNGHATDRVLIYLDDGAMTRKEGEKITKLEFKRGDVRWRPHTGPYISENVGDHPIRILEIDLKGPPAGPAPVTNL